MTNDDEPQLRRLSSLVGRLTAKRVDIVCAKNTKLLASV
jgi:hypothetical protein